MAIVVSGAIASRDDAVQWLANPRPRRAGRVLDEIRFMRQRAPIDACAEPSMIDVELELGRSPGPAAHLHAQAGGIVGEAGIINNEGEGIHARLYGASANRERPPISK